MRHSARDSSVTRLLFSFILGLYKRFFRVDSADFLIADTWLGCSPTNQYSLASLAKEISGCVHDLAESGSSSL
jgi:hypothetical protein